MVGFRFSSFPRRGASTSSSRAFRFPRRHGGLVRETDGGEVQEVLAPAVSISICCIMPSGQCSCCAATRGGYTCRYYDMRPLCGRCVKPQQYADGTRGTREVGGGPFCGPCPPPGSMWTSREEMLRGGSQVTGRRTSHNEIASIGEVWYQLSLYEISGDAW